MRKTTFLLEVLWGEPISLPFPASRSFLQCLAHDLTSLPYASIIMSPFLSLALLLPFYKDL